MPETAANKPTVRAIDELDPARIKEIEHFFVSYNEMQGRRFKPGRPQGPRQAERQLRAAMQRFRAPAA